MGIRSQWISNGPRTGKARKLLLKSRWILLIAAFCPSLSRISGELFIVQARPETVRSRQTQATLRQTVVEEHGDTVVEGTAIGSDAATGPVRVIEDLADISRMKKGEILVADMTDPDCKFRCVHLPRSLVLCSSKHTC